MAWFKCYRVSINFFLIVWFQISNLLHKIHYRLWLVQLSDKNEWLRYINNLLQIWIAFKNHTSFLFHGFHCYLETCCGVAPDDPHLYITDRSSFSIGEILHYDCQPGFKAEPQGFIECDINGELFKLPECKSKCWNNSHFATTLGSTSTKIFTYHS